MSNTCSAQSEIVWYIPGFENQEQDYSSVLQTLREIYPQSESVEVKTWDAPHNQDIRVGIDWASAILKAEQAAENVVQDIKRLTDSEQSRLIIVGYSLGGRVAIRSIAQFRNSKEKKATFHQLVLLGAAINNDDKDFEVALETCTEPVINIVNVQDWALRTYGLFERSGALGNGSYLPINPEEIIEVSSIQGISHNHHKYLDRLKKTIIEKKLYSGRGYCTAG